MSSMIIVADQGWSWIASDKISAQKTFLIGFSLDGPKSAHAVVGSVDGYLLNPFSIDFVEKPGGSYVRIATTQDFWTPWFGGPVGRPGIVIIEDAAGTAESEVPPKSSTLNQIIALKVPSTSTPGKRELQKVGSVELGEINEVSWL
jgi:hypothetical protein